MDGLIVDTENMIHKKLKEILEKMGFHAEREMLISMKMKKLLYKKDFGSY